MEVRIIAVGAEILGVAQDKMIQNETAQPFQKSTWSTGSITLKVKGNFICELHMQKWNFLCFCFADQQTRLCETTCILKHELVDEPTFEAFPFCS